MSDDILDFEGRKFAQEALEMLLADAYKREVAASNLSATEMKADLRKQRYPERVVKKIIADLFGNDAQSVTAADGSEVRHAGNDEARTKMNNVVPLSKHSRPVIDWGKVEAIRAREYPRIPKKAVAIIEQMFEQPSDSAYFEIHSQDGDYPPNPIPLLPSQGDAAWMLDLLDRYGGELRYGNQRYMVERKEKRHALFLLQSISQESYQALNLSIGPEYEHFLQSKKWTVLGREATDKLMFFVVSSRIDESRIYLGLFDRQTARVLFERMETGVSIERALMI